MARRPGRGMDRMRIQILRALKCNARRRGALDLTFNGALEEKVESGRARSDGVEHRLISFIG